MGEIYLRVVYTRVYREVYPWWPYYPGVYTLLYTPGYTLYIRPCPVPAVRGVYGCAVRSNEALGSNLGIVRRREASARLKVPFLLEESGQSAQDPSALPG